MNKKNIIEVKNLTKKYGKIIAVDNISFSVNEGEIFGLLGENGAGKTTTLEVIEGLRKPTKGEIHVLNCDTQKHLSQVKEQIGVQLQSSAYYQFLRLGEILNLFASFYSKHSDPLKLLKMVELDKKVNSFIGDLSGGQQQRFSIVASLINNPQVVFLDEPTTGLDPMARRHLWEIISKIKSEGKTIILTTHYLEEAEMLCDRVAIMEKGKIIAIGQTHKLVEKTKIPFKIRFFAKDVNKNIFEKFGTLKNIAGKSDDFELYITSRDNLKEAISEVQKLNPESMTVMQANLEDLFIELTGKTIQDEENNA